MARVLAISSYVAYGHVGLSAMVPALQALGHEVVALPSVVLSNHRGYRHCRGLDVDWPTLSAMLSAVDASGGLQALDAVLTGYIPSAEIAGDLARFIKRRQMMTPDLVYLCDPVLGDDPGGLYVAAAAADAVRGDLLPLADIATPNRFELDWLAGASVRSMGDVAAAAARLAPARVVATSVPVGGLELASVMTGDDLGTVAARVPRLPDVPRGTGDLFAALLLGHHLAGRTWSEALARAAAGVAVVVEASLGAPELKLVETLAAAVTAPAMVLEGAR